MTLRRRATPAPWSASPASAHRVVAALLAGLTAVVLGVGTLVWNAPSARADEPVKVLLLLDVSGSMNGRIASGGTKFAAAKRALKEVAGSLPGGTQVGLRVYGSEIAEDQTKNPKACSDTRLVLPVGPLDQRRMDRAVDSFTAKGETPIAYSLGKAVDDLGSAGKRVVVLISDGQETCAKDPCPTAEKLAKSGVDLQFNAIGLAVDAKARAQLKCIAEAGDGSYYDASRAADLSNALRKITQRALRPFQVSGTPVRGAVDQAQAPTIGAGQYTDRYDVSTTPRYYRISRRPGSAVTASISSIVRPVGNNTLESWALRLTSASGEVCGTASAGASSFWTTSVVSSAVSAGGGFHGPREPASCTSDPNLLLSLIRKPYSGTRKLVPVEILIAEEPAIANLAALPPGVAAGSGGTVKAVSVKGRAKPVVGGSAFANAAEVGPGAWTDTSALGETLLYRVPLQPGQRLRVTLTAPAPGTSSGLTSASVVLPNLRLYSPSRSLLTRAYTALGAGQRVRVSAQSPPVRVRNREQDAVNDRVDQASIAGDYYVGVTLEPGQADLTGQVTALRLDIAVTGQPAGLPAYVVATPTPAATASAAPSSSGGPSTPSAPTTPAAQQETGSRWTPILLVVVVLAVLGGVAGLLVRRRRSPSARHR